ncbi:MULTISPECIES: transcription termination factor NusA [Alicyclobacillus]|uniref:Transcription termination/antitermination protein NusA n=1 Tax=Alicyclobacillus acidoterrestris (strain ATCC 49025 / DSM 3922 / CIP 106132 / NCIMB 13137 / GD3B) TaxID=1356854 RepID=T0D950_ALIAG|nr:MULTISPECIES: transcription termination factor NusA [Alicyclobacillus]EPZ46226.1 transcription elongation factor NusA [Alicyclobacillus acidoterrestris ATCC 49025]UNO47139.1 transcription termination factor NusA [Alicyclobacillus acidoterrestris]
MNVDFLEALEQLAREKGIDKEVLLEAIEAALISGYKRNFNSAANVRVDIHRDNGEVRVFARKTVVEEPEDTRLEISLDAARDMNPNYQVGDVVEIEVTPRDFGRIAAQTAKQVVTQRIREAERSVIYGKFVDREEEVVTGIVARIDPRVAYIDLGETEAILPQSEQMPTDKLQMGDRIKVFIARVERTTKGPQIVVSRSHPGLLKRLFELEVPEIYDGVVEIKAVSREAGYRSKIAVHSRNPEVDPIGACVGTRGVRVQSVVTELNGEKVDIVEWSEDPATFVANALSPAKVVDVQIDEEEKVARTIVPDYQLSLAIGKEGQNARLAARLTGWKIDIKNETQASENGLFGDFDGASDEDEDEIGQLSDDWLTEP